MIAGKRIVPDFIIIGAMKAGTTTLYSQLAQHPEIGMSRDKETDFFIAEKNHRRGTAWYAAQFDPGRPVHGEASPNYTKCRDFPGVPQRMRGYCPDVRLIYQVRDPVERAISQYRHSWAMGKLPDDPREIEGTHEYHHLMDASHYCRQLEAFLAVFPREVVLVVDFDRLVSSPQDTMDDVLDFIGVARVEVTAPARKNAGEQMSRIPTVILRASQTAAGRFVSHHVDRGMRDWLRQRLARGTGRRPPEFPPEMRQRMREELRADAMRFRTLTGMSFPRWSV